MVRGEVGGGRNRVRAPPVDTTDLDSPFDQITRLEDGRFRDSNPIAPKQSISSFRISISPLSVAWIKTARKIIFQNSDQSSSDLSYRDLSSISQNPKKSKNPKTSFKSSKLKLSILRSIFTFFLERKPCTIFANRFKSFLLREKKRGSKVADPWNTSACSGGHLLGGK